MSRWTWAQTPAAALEWLQGNRDAAAVIVEVHSQSCASFVEQLRGLGLTTPVVVVLDPRDSNRRSPHSTLAPTDT